MPEPTLEFIGQRLNLIQDQMHTLRSDNRLLFSRLDQIVDRMDRMSDRLAEMLKLLEQQGK